MKNLEELKFLFVLPYFEQHASNIFSRSWLLLGIFILFQKEIPEKQLV